MTIKPLVVAIPCLLSIILGAPEARAQNEEACRAVLTARNQQDDAAPCFLLAVFVWQTLTRDTTAEILKPDSIPVGAIFSQRDLQNRTPQAPALSGTPALSGVAGRDGRCTQVGLTGSIDERAVRLLRRLLR